MTLSEFEYQSFLKKLARLVAKAGYQVLEKALYLFYAARNPNTPEWARRVVYGALAYTILPIDAIPDFLPVVGFTDDLGVITLALSTISYYITPEIKQQAKQTLSSWYPATK